MARRNECRVATIANCSADRGNCETLSELVPDNTELATINRRRVEKRRWATARPAGVLPGSRALFRSPPRLPLDCTAREQSAVERGANTHLPPEEASPCRGGDASRLRTSSSSTGGIRVRLDNRLWSGCGCRRRAGAAHLDTDTEGLLPESAGSGHGCRYGSLMLQSSFDITYGTV